MIRFPLAAALALTALHAAPAQAGPITSLEECYQAVINWCVETHPDHADQCGNASGLNDCDDAFGNAAAGLASVRFGPAISPRSFSRLMVGADQRRMPVLRAVSR